MSEISSCKILLIFPHKPIQSDCTTIQCCSEHQVQDQVQEANVVLLKDGHHPLHVLGKIGAGPNAL